MPWTRGCAVHVEVAFARCWEYRGGMKIMKSLSHKLSNPPFDELRVNGDVVETAEILFVRAESFDTPAVRPELSRRIRLAYSGQACQSTEMTRATASEWKEQ